MNHITPKMWVGLQSVDYAVTHVGKKYPEGGVARTGG
jgi:hypothetical protein